MPRERDPPYVASGFRDDAQRLLDRFVAKKSVKFADFAEIWRYLRFSTVFMGRESVRELTEFIEECYRNALLFMAASDPYQKVGVVYLLYSIYVKQPPILKSQIPIRVNIRQIFEIYSVESHFLDTADCDDDVLDLTYIVTKLFKMEAFSISCFPIPMGPSVPISLLKLEPLRNSCFKEMLGFLRMVNENDIKNITELSRSHEELKKQLPICGTYTEPQELNKFEEIKETIEKLEHHYNSGVFPNVLRTLHPNRVSESQHGATLSQGQCSEAVMESSDIKLQKDFKRLGQRRAFLKAQQFEMPVGFSNVTEVRSAKRARSSSESSESAPPTPEKKKRGRPKLKKPRRRGRKKVEVGTEVGAAGERDIASVGNKEDDIQIEGENVDNPEELNPVPYFPYRRPSKYPRPVRKLYFQNEEGIPDE